MFGDERLQLIELLALVLRILLQHLADPTQVLKLLQRLGAPRLLRGSFELNLCNGGLGLHTRRLQKLVLVGDFSGLLFEAKKASQGGFAQSGLRANPLAACLFSEIKGGASDRQRILALLD